MTCSGCDNQAEYWVEVSPSTYQEHCRDCMHEAICAEPVKIINIADLEAKSRGQAISKTA